MKNICICIIMSICVSLSFHQNIVYADYSSDYSDEMLEVAYNSLYAMGLWINCEDADEYITRAEVADWICMLACNSSGHKHGEEVGCYRIYQDVPENHWAFNYICVAGILRGESIMTGDGNGYFRPDEYITNQEFVKVLLHMTFWGFYTQYFDSGYPEGYFNVAEKLGIYPLRKEKMNNPLTENDAVILVYNALRAPMIDGIPFTVGEYQEYIGRTYLSHYCSTDTIYDKKGYAKKIDEGQILIDDMIYYGSIDSDGFEEGKVICLFRKTDDKNYILYCCPISSYDFDNPKPVSNDLPKLFHVQFGEVVEYESGLGSEVESR